jgi:hypothetical protein
MPSIKVCPFSEIDGLARCNFGPDLPDFGVDPDAPDFGVDPDAPETDRSLLTQILERKSPFQDFEFMSDPSPVVFDDLPDAVEEPVDGPIAIIDEFPDDCADFIESERSFVGKVRNMAAALF